jgi:hypothetical protein
MPMVYPDEPSRPATPQPMTPQRPRRLLIAAIAGLILAIVVPVATGWFVYTRVFKEDPGLAVCETLRQDASDGDDNPGSDNDVTQSDYIELRDAFEDSRHDDLRDAGTRFADVYWQTEQAGSGSLRSSDRDRLLSSLIDLQGACANHDIIITIEWND